MAEITRETTAIKCGDCISPLGHCYGMCRKLVNLLYAQERAAMTEPAAPMSDSDEELARALVMDIVNCIRIGRPDRMPYNIALEAIQEARAAGEREAIRALLHPAPPVASEEPRRGG